MGSILHPGGCEGSSWVLGEPRALLSTQGWPHQNAVPHQNTLLRPSQLPKCIREQLERHTQCWLQKFSPFPSVT